MTLLKSISGIRGTIGAVSYTHLYMVLIMSVTPGFGEQKFIEHYLDKVRELRELITVTGSQALIEVDGGVNLETGSRCV